MVLLSFDSYSRSTAAILFVAVVFCIYGLYIPLGTINIRPEKILTLILIIPFTAKYLILSPGEYTRTNFLLTLWVLLGLMVSILSIDPGPMLKHWLDLSLSIFFFYFIYSCRLDNIFLFRPSHLLGIGFVLGLCGSVIAALYWIGISVENNFLSNFAYLEEGKIRIKMTLWESNIYGAVMAVFCLLSVTEKRENSRVDWTIVFFCHAGLFLSYSRGPLVAYFVSLIFYYKIIGKKNLGRLLTVVFLAVLAFSTYKLVGMGLGYEEEGGFMRYHSIATRFIVLDAAFKTIAQHPILGSGIYSAESLYKGLGVEVGASDEAKGWIGILPVAILHDTGIVGFILFYGFFYIIFRNAYKSISWHRMWGTSPEMEKRMAAWLGAGASLHVISLSTSVYSMGLFWGVMAIVAIIPKIDPELPIHKTLLN